MSHGLPEERFLQVACRGDAVCATVAVNVREPRSSGPIGVSHRGEDKDELGRAGRIRSTGPRAVSEREKRGCEGRGSVLHLTRSRPSSCC